MCIRDRYSGAAGFLIPAAAGTAPEFEQQNGQTLQAGDIFYEINGERVYLYSDVSLLMSLHQGQPMDLVVLRDGEKVELNDITWGTYTGTEGETYQGYGIYIAGDQVEEANLWTLLKTSWLNTIDFVRIVRLSLQMLVTGQAGMDDLSGPVGIVSTITQVGTCLLYTSPRRTGRGPCSTPGCSAPPQSSPAGAGTDPPAAGGRSPPGRRWPGCW